MQKENAMTRAAVGSTVTVHYVGTLDNGRIFDATTDEEPLVFTLGSGQVFPALEAAIIGMARGEVRNIVLTAAEAYGPRLEANVIRVERSCFPPDREIVVGQKLSIAFAGGQERIMLVAAVAEESVTLDGNHPLAGLDLTFALRLDGVR
jgi:FKBP-type peptidyl-prolyl cis-trans isomerase 2